MLIVIIVMGTFIPMKQEEQTWEVLYTPHVRCNPGPSTQAWQSGMERDRSCHSYEGRQHVNVVYH